MRQSQLFYKTEKIMYQEKEAISFDFLSKGGFIDRLSSGIYSLLPLGFLVHKKIENIIRREMNNIGAQEVFLPSLQPKEIWEKSGRWSLIDPPLFKVEDRHKKIFALGSTHEEVITNLAKKKIVSYRDLPFALFQIQTKFRNEMRFFGGLLRAREFVMKDLYSFHADEKDFWQYYQKTIDAYFNIFKKCGLKVLMVEASGQGFTNSITHEFQAITPSGEDRIIFCSSCRFAQNKEIAKNKEGEKCTRCGSFLQEERGVEVGNIFSLGDKYSKDFNLFFVDKKNQKKMVIMGCYGIGLGRLMATAVEINHDKKGIIWPKEIAPYQVHLLAIDNKNIEVEKLSEKIYKNLQDWGVEVLYDDRKQVSPGEKFSEADLIGIPTRMLISQKLAVLKSVEIKKRDEEKKEIIKSKDILSKLKS